MDIKKPKGIWKTKWHPAFVDAFRQELFDYWDSLEFKDNHPLAREALEIDLLIIKKSKDLTIDKNIARIFRADNIIEYKSPADYLAFKDYLKVYAYANLYAAITPGVDFADITLTFVERRYPRTLLQYLTRTRGYTTEETSPGIYLVAGDYLPIQIIESGKLSDQENLWLKSLRKEPLPVVNVNSILDTARNLGDKAQLSAYLYVLMKEHPEVFLEAENMARARHETFEEVFTRAGLIPEWIERGRAQGLEQGRVQGLEQGLESAARNALAKGLPIDVIHDITGLDIQTIEQWCQAQHHQLKP